MLIQGCTTAVEHGRPWMVRYSIGVDAKWTTRAAQTTQLSVAGARRVLIQGDGLGSWRLDDRHASQLDGCLDIDRESSAMTNALPVLRLDLPVGTSAEVPAVYVPAETLAVERLEQRYSRVSDRDGLQQHEYCSPAINFSARLVYDDAGLVMDYPGIAVRAG